MIITTSLFTKLPWPKEIERTLRSSSQAATCPLATKISSNIVKNLNKNLCGLDEITTNVFSYKLDQYEF